MDIEKLKYPIGKFQRAERIDHNQISGWIDTLANFPQKLKKASQGLSKDQLDWRYRPDGWSIRQLVHHCADSHMNSFIRFKWTLTEDSPTIKAYHEDRWAEMSDYKADINDSLMIIEGLHNRWCRLLKDLTVEDQKKYFVHPEHGGQVPLYVNIGLYAWHCAHHLAHIEQALKHKGEFNQ